MFFLARWWCNIFHCKDNTDLNNNNNDNMACTSGTKDAKCVQYTGVALSCAGILKNDYLDVILSKINNKLCSSAGGSVTSVAVSSTDLSVSGSPITTSGTIILDIKNGAVTYARIQNVGAVCVVGNPTGSTASVSEIGLSTGLAFSGSSIICTNDATNQRVGMLVDNALIGTRKAINLIAGANVTLSGSDDNTNNRVNVTINTSSSGGSGSPGGSNGQLQYNSSGTFGGTIAGMYTTSGNLFVYTAQAATDVPLTLKGASSQSANILNVRNSSNTIIASIDSSGNIAGTNLSGTNTGDQTITLTGDVTGSGTGSFAATIAAGAVSNAKFRDSSALSIVGRTSNSSGSVADISAGTDGFVLRRSGTSLAFGQVATGGITNSAVTKVKFEDITTQTLLGRYAGTDGVMQEITLDSSLTLNTSTGVLSTSSNNKSFITLTDGATVTWTYTSGFNAQFTIGGNRTLAIFGDADGDYGTLIVTQDGTGNRDLTVPAGDKLLNGIGTGTTIDLTNTAGAIDILSYVKRGSVRYWTQGYYH